jgi:hypothetical protein
MSDTAPTVNQGSGPGARIAPGRPRYRVMWLALACSVACAVTLRVMETPLRTPEAPNGIVSLELAWNSERAGRMVASWNDDARRHAAFSLGFDYLFLCAYGALTWSLLRRRALALERVQRVRWARICSALSLAAWAAAGCDALENAALWRVLADPAAPWPAIATWLATVKFAILALLTSLWLATWPMIR